MRTLKHLPENEWPEADRQALRAAYEPGDIFDETAGPGTLARRSRIELSPNQQGQLEIDLYGDLAGILTLAGRKKTPIDQNDKSVQQVKVVAWVGFEPTTFRL